MMEAFDRGVPAWLLHNIREMTIHPWIVKWVGSFISNRTTMHCLLGYSTDIFLIHTGIPQGSLLSLIIFLLYNANLVNASNPHT